MKHEFHYNQRQNATNSTGSNICRHIYTTCTTIKCLIIILLTDVTIKERFPEIYTCIEKFKMLQNRWFVYAHMLQSGFNKK